jgi:hypothetical protein
MGIIDEQQNNKQTKRKNSMAKKQRAPKPKQVEIALTGVGVELTTDKKLIELGDAFMEEKDTKIAAQKRLKELDAEILNRMDIINLKCYRIGSKFWRIEAKRHIKVTNVKEPKVKALDDSDTAGA